MTNASPDAIEDATPDAAVQARAVLRDVFGYGAFRDRQQAIIEHLVAGGDALVLMPTGGGKSLCYQIPALLREGTAVVVSPLIALMQDQVEALRQLGVAAAFLNSSLDAETAREVTGRLMRGEIDLLYVAPERLLMPGFLSLLDQVQVWTNQLKGLSPRHCYVKVDTGKPILVRTPLIQDPKVDKDELGAVLSTYRKLYQKSRSDAERARSDRLGRLHPLRTARA